MSDHLSATPAHSIICCLACSMAGTEKFGISVFLEAACLEHTWSVVAEEEQRMRLAGSFSERIHTLPTMLGLRVDLREGPRIDQNGLAD
jgi:hypothetical protein